MGNMIGIHQQSGKIDAYYAVPQKTIANRGAVIIVHEIWGLTDHIKHVADRVAAQGYYVLAPDLFSSAMANRRPSESLQKDLFSQNERVRYNAQPRLRAMIGPTQTPQFTSMAISRLASCFEYMYNQPLAHQKVMIMGFGMGGTYALDMAIRESRLIGVISFYGHAQFITPELRHIHCPILAFYGQNEQAMTTELERLVPRMKQAGARFTPVIYAGAGHAFFNDTNPFSYNSGAAEDSWHRTVSFLRDRMNDSQAST
jgi:carboxymethylenebutenolidase